MSRVVAFTGLPRSGKDTAARYLAETHGFQILQFSEPLKQVAALLLGCPIEHARGHGYDREQVMPEWGFSMRHFLQVMGTECVRDHFGADFWVRKMRNNILAVRRAFNADVVITDLRFDNEAAMVRELGGVVIEIVRPFTVRSGHVSDKGVAADYQILNDSTIEALHARVASVT